MGCQWVFTTCETYGSISNKTNSSPFHKLVFLVESRANLFKEHMLITIFASSGYSGVYAIDIITIVNAFYHKHPSTRGLFVST